MLYQHRWLITGVFIAILIVVGYVYDIHPMMVQLEKLNQSERNENKKLLEVKSQPIKSHSQASGNLTSDKNKLNELGEFLSFIHSSGLNIQTVGFSSSRPSELPQSELVHFVLKGDYQQLSKMIFGLERQANSISLQNFSYKWTEQNNLLINMDILFSRQIRDIKIANNNEVLNSQYNPFCSPDNLAKWVNKSDLNFALSAPLESIKMVGYLQRGKHRQALVLLPNTVMRTVEPGFLLGSEKGMVIAVHRNRTLVKLPDGRGVTLALEPYQK